MWSVPPLELLSGWTVSESKLGHHVQIIAKGPGLALGPGPGLCLGQVWRSQGYSARHNYTRGVTKYDNFFLAPPGTTKTEIEQF